MHVTRDAQSTKHIVLFIIILMLAATFRFVGTNWDQSQHQNPDERFLTMVATGLSWPTTPLQYFDTATSPVNPHNKNFSFYVYGTWPILLVKYVAELISWGDYGHLVLVGRFFSGLADLGTVIVVYCITKRIARIAKLSNVSALLAMLAYACFALPIQLSHFYVTDPYLIFCLTVTFYCLLFPVTWKSVGAIGLLFGIAVGAKISGVVFAPIIAIAWIYQFVKSSNKLMFILLGVFFVFVSFLSLRVSLPYLFSGQSISGLPLNPKLLANWKQLESFDGPTANFPPAIQWITTTPYFFPAIQAYFWGIGIFLGTLFTIVSIWMLGSFKRLNIHMILVFLWILLLFAYQGGQFAKPLRYFASAYPMIAIVIGIGTESIVSKLKYRRIFYGLFAILTILWPLAFIRIYLVPHTRVTASEWIYKYIPKTAVLSGEYWDDGLPLCLSPQLCNKYQHEELHMFDPDTAEKWTRLKKQLEHIDYLILSSNRVYGAIGTVPEQYKTTDTFYKLMFSNPFGPNQLGFARVAEFSSRPNWSIPPFQWCIFPPFLNYGEISKEGLECNIPGITIVDDFADETWTVYDHPKVIIFKRVTPATWPF